jgi:hypothetical protein
MSMALRLRTYPIWTAVLGFSCFLCPTFAAQVAPNDRVTSKLRVRAEAASHAEVIVYLKLGDSAELVKTVGGWRKTRLPNTTGYLFSAYAKVVPDNPSAPAPVAAGRPTPESASLVGNQHILLGLPLDTDASDDFLIDRTHWVPSHNPARLAANWGASRLVSEDLGREDRSNAFAPQARRPPTSPHPHRSTR